MTDKPGSESGERHRPPSARNSYSPSETTSNRLDRLHSHPRPSSVITSPIEKEKLKHTSPDLEAASPIEPEITNRDNLDDDDGQPGRFSQFYARYHLFFHLAFAAVATGWWITGLVLHRKLGWLVPFLVWLIVMLRIVSLHVPIFPLLLRALVRGWKLVTRPVLSVIPDKLKTLAGAAAVVAVFLIGTYATEQTDGNSYLDRTISLLGLVVIVAGLWATSRNRRKINWRVPIVGFLAQYVIALFVLRTKTGYDIFKFISDLCRALLGFAFVGLAFLTDDSVPSVHWFIISVLPAVIFFVSLIQVLHYYGFLQWFVRKSAVFFFWAMQVSGAEAVVAAASPFVGQGESVVLIKSFVRHLTKAEIHQVMASGFATIAGSVLVAYIGLGISPQALISSCVMSIPAALACSKMRYPEEEHTATAGKVTIPDDDEDDRAVNALHAFAGGCMLGVKIAAMIAATLMCMVSLVGFADGLLGWAGRYLGIANLSMEMILGYVCYPVAFLMGVSRNGDLLKVGKLIGVKVMASEFVAYSRLTDGERYPEYAGLTPRSRLVATYALCGFGNLGSLGTQISVLGQLCPGRAGDVSRLAMSALITGIISTLSSATIAGLVITEPAQYVTVS